MTVSVRTPDAAAIKQLAPRLAEILADCVAGGASVGFLEPHAATAAAPFWGRVREAVAADVAVLLVAELDGVAVGTVLLDCDTFPNQPHRATVGKLLVHRAARRRGIGEALMVEVERVALARGRWLLTLDTATEAAARLYDRRGWTVAGTIPDYALNPDGSLVATTFYWKRLVPARS